MAGGASYQDDDGAITEINVTPLVDVMLVLLVIFMVTTRLIATRGIDVTRPTEASGGDVEGKLAPIFVTVARDGAVYVEGVAHPDRATAVAALRARAATMREPKAIIDGDEGAAYAAVMYAIGIVKEARIDRIALANQAPPR
jgi:biopolymer transport protein ExbD